MQPLDFKQRLTPYNFFSNFIVAPLSSQLSTRDKAIALLGSVIFALLTLGIVHIKSAILRSKRIAYYKNTQLTPEALQRSIQKINNCRPLIQESVTTSTSLLTRQTIGEQIQKHLIDPYYAQTMPSLKNVEVTLTDDNGQKVTRKWANLTREQRVRVNNEGTHPHNQLKGPLAPLIVDFFFAPPFTQTGIKKDPRLFHGCDHSIRTSLYSAGFAYLYQQHLPKTHVTRRDVLRAQWAGAGHDAGRDTEGADVYDPKSAAITEKALKLLGIESAQEIHDCHEAIAEKDKKDLRSKSLVARCVQNADSVEFFRLGMPDSLQDPEAFIQGVEYLDIYKEMKQLHEDRHVTNEQFDEFKEELTNLRKEMNTLIAMTSQPEFRQRAAESVSYYDEVVKCITPASFPLLYHVLKKMEVIPAPFDARREYILEQANAWISHGLEYVSTKLLIQLRDQLTKVHQPIERIDCVQKELTRREEITKKYEEAKAHHERDQMVSFYAQLPPVLQDTIDICKDCCVTSLKELITFLKPETLARQLIEFKEKVHTLQSLSGTPEQLFSQAQKAAELYASLPISHREARDQTSIAMALRHAAKLFLKEKNSDQHRKVIEFAATHLTPLPQFERLMNEASSHVCYFETGTDEVRRHKARLEAKTIDGVEQYELSFELTAHAREELNKKLRSNSTLYRVKNIPAQFEQKRQGQFSSSHAAKLGIGHLPMCLEKWVTPKESEEISIRIGHNKLFWNQHHLLRIRFKKTTKPQEIQALLCRLGLMTALMPPRQQDIQVASLARLLAFRYPDHMYSVPKKSPQELYETLTEEQKKSLLEDMSHLRKAFTGETIETVDCTMAKKARDAGAKAIGIGICAGDTRSTAGVLANILRSGFLSSQERHQRGFIGLGTAPLFNNFAGSANQVFSRILTKSFVSHSPQLTTIHWATPLFCLCDTKAFERMPYAYERDQSGWRNQHTGVPIYPALGNTPEEVLQDLGMNGQKVMTSRLSLLDHIQSLEKAPHLNNECMFEGTLSGSYIRKIVVQTEKDRRTVLDELQRQNILTIHDTPIEQAVIVNDKITPEMIDTLVSPSEEEATLYDVK